MLMNSFFCTDNIQKHSHATSQSLEVYLNFNLATVAKSIFPSLHCRLTKNHYISQRLIYDAGKFSRIVSPLTERMTLL